MENVNKKDLLLFITAKDLRFIGLMVAYVLGIFSHHISPELSVLFFGMMIALFFVRNAKEIDQYFDGMDLSIFRSYKKEDSRSIDRPSVLAGVTLVVILPLILSICMPGVA